MPPWRPIRFALPTPAPRWAGFGRDALHLAVLVNFAVAQPLYEVLGRGAEFFVARGSGAAEVLLLVGALAVGLPMAGILLEAIVGLVSGALRRAVHALLGAVCLTAVVLQAIRHLSVLPGDMLVVDAAVLGMSLTALYLYWQPVRMTLSVLAPAPLVFASIFLFGTPVSEVLVSRAADGGARPAVARPRTVVLVVFDELNGTLLLDEHRRIDRARYPNLAALAGRATWYRAATTVADSTTEAVPAILTGQRPVWSRRRLPTARAHPGSLFTLLAESHGLVGYEPVTRLCPAGLCSRAAVTRTAAESTVGLARDVAIVYLHALLPLDLRRELPSTTRNWTDFGKESRDDPALQFRRFLGAIERSDRPALYVVHTLLPHEPWRYLPSGRRYELVQGFPAEGWELGGEEAAPTAYEWTAAHELQRHLLQLGFVDRLVGELVARLERVGLYDEALLIVTADHGLSFRPALPRRKLRPGNVGDILPVPLLIKHPDQRAGEVRDDTVETIDILPTIADVLDVRVPWTVDGRSLLGPPRPAGEPRRAMSSETRSVLEVDARLEARWATLTWMHRTVGSGADPDGLYRIGPYGSLVGRPLAALEARAADGHARVAIAGAEAWEGVDPRADLVPVWVSGRLKLGPVPADRVHLAVSVNGVVRAVTSTRLREGGASQFFAMLPEAALHAGRNEVDVFLVSGPPTRPRLQRIERHP